MYLWITEHCLPRPAGRCRPQRVCNRQMLIDLQHQCSEVIGHEHISMTAAPATLGLWATLQRSSAGRLFHDTSCVPLARAALIAVRFASGSIIHKVDDHCAPSTKALFLSEMIGIFANRTQSPPCAFAEYNVITQPDLSGKILISDANNVSNFSCICQRGLASLLPTLTSADVLTLKHRAYA